MKDDPGSVVVVEQHSAHITRLTSGDMSAPCEWVPISPDDCPFIRQFPQQTQLFRRTAQIVVGVVTVFCGLDLAAAAIANFLRTVLLQPSGAH